MDVVPGDDDVWIGTGSKDKSIAISTLGRLDDGRPLWSSNFHSAKVSSVCFSSLNMANPLLASASDDGLVAVHDARLDGVNNNGVVARLEGIHYKPHSVVWKPNSDRDFVTAGLDEFIKLWDLRNTSSPIGTYHGHVPTSGGRKLKRIHRPTFLNSSSDSYILSGGENSNALSLFQLKNRGLHDSSSLLQPVFSRGKLPIDVGDVGGVATCGKHVAFATEGGDVLLLSHT
jgi:WD40 repeat protein